MYSICNSHILTSVRSLTLRTIPSTILHHNFLNKSHLDSDLLLEDSQKLTRPIIIPLMVHIIICQLNRKGCV